MFPPRLNGSVVVPTGSSSISASCCRYGTSMSTIAWSQNAAGGEPPVHDVLLLPSAPDGPGVTKLTLLPVTEPAAPGPPGWIVSSVLAYVAPKLRFSWT